MRAKKDEIPYGSERYGNEAKRLYGVLDKRLSQAAYLADEYSVADIATFPWVARHEWHRVDLAAFPNVRRWYDTILRRPAVIRGMEVPFLN
jgi:GST-like protein